MNRKSLIILSVLVISLLGGLVYGVGLSKNNKKEIFNVDNSLKNDIAIGSTKGTTTNNTINTSSDTVVAMGGEEVKVEEKVANEENNVVSGGNEVKTNADSKTENKVENTVSNNTNSSNKAENVSVSNNNSSSKPNNTVSSKPSNNTSSNNSSTSKPSNNSSSKPSTPAHTHTWKDETKVVHHDEEGYWDTVVVKEAWVEEVPKYEQKVLSICNSCGKDITGFAGEHVQEHMLAGNDKGGHHTEVRQVQVGVDKINHPAVTEKRWIVSKPAWDETVVVGSVCSGCGAKK